MPAYWRKALRDFWRERTRTLLVVLAIAIGIAAFSAVLSTYAILVRELDRGYLATNPASATLLTDRVDDALLAGVLQGHGVAQAEARRVVSGRIKAGPVEWRQLVLFVVKDYADIRVSRLVPQQGAWPPATGELLIERDAFQVARARIGEQVQVRMADGSERALRVGGSVHDVGQAQARMENIVYGYITLATLAQLGESPYLDQLKLVVAENARDLAHVKQVAADVAKWLEGQGHPVRRVDVPAPGKHPHSDIMGLLLLAQAGFGFFALLLSGILVVNLLTALMAAQVRQIGVMKAIGATRRQIARIYLGQALMLGIAALGVALPLGVWGGRALCRYMAGFLNFDISSFTVPWWVYLLDGAVGVLVPLLAAAHPVARGCAVSVREALADHGVTQSAFGTTALDRMLAGISGIGRPLLLSIRNSFRRRARLAMTVATLSLAGVFFMSALNLRASFVRTLDRMFGSMRYDLTVSFAKLLPLEKVERAVRGTPGVARAEGWITTEASLAETSEPAPDAERFSVIALPAGTDFLRPDIVEGRGLRAGDSDVLVVNSALAARSPRLKVGSLVTLRMGPQAVALRVVGRSREPFSPAQAYVPLEYFEALGHAGVTNSLRLALLKNDAAALAVVRAGLDANLEREELRAQNSGSTADRRYSFDQHMLMIYVFLLVMAGLLVGVGGLGLMTTMSLNVLERRREMGILRAIGARPRAVWLIVVGEGVVVAAMSWALGALAAWPIGKGVGDFMVARLFKTGLDFRFEPSGLLVWLGISLALGAAASFLPAWHAARSSVREAIGYE